MNIELKGQVGDKIAIIGEIVQVIITKDGIMYDVDIPSKNTVIRFPDADCEKTDKKETETASDQENEVVYKVSEAESPKLVAVKRKPGRPKKATVEGTMKKFEEMKARGEA